MRYRIALCGFSDFEHRAMQFSFHHLSGTSESEYEVVGDLTKADFTVVNADAQAAVTQVLAAGRLPHAVFVGARAPAGAAWHLPRPIDTTRIVRTLNEITAGRTVPATFHSAPVERVFPTLDDVVDAESDPPPTLNLNLDLAGAEVQPPAAADTPLPETGVTANDGGAAGHRTLQSLAKAAARAAARRARLASTRSAPGAAESAQDVLVLDADPAANAQLCDLLGRFGFQALPIRTIEAARAELPRRPYAAVFLDIAFDEAGVELLQLVRALPTSPAVVLVTAHLDPAERVRAALAGITAPLTKPVGRGDVARALEAVGVALPTDARRL